MALSGLRIDIRGRVQGVGFRPWVFGLAVAADLRGRVWNDCEGVCVEAFGDEKTLRDFAAALWHPPAPAARVDEIRCQAISLQPPAGFTVEESRDEGVRLPSIPPDWATCDECRRELNDGDNRRHAYPFLNCTRCGPRFSISLDVPYDRRQTTMAAFVMCADCRREYEDPRDRRFHAEANACPACGPHLALIGPRGAPLAGAAVATAAALLRRGGILAVKGLGGFHLACDATSAATVSALRQRKHRDEKPFAVMVRDTGEAERAALLSPAERALLESGERPIVLVERRPQARICDEVAPRSPMLGLMLPYTPLHELLLGAVQGPLVMTSANLSDQPMVCDDADARDRLRGIADALLLHDRAIANRCDDSVARVIGARPVVLRRSRGHVPVPIRLRQPVPRPMLACGGHLKNAFCLAQGDRAWLGPHIGDLETDEICRAFEETVERFQRFVGITPEILVHDLHPDYFTTRYAVERAPTRCIGVQHHHAHVASCMADNELAGPVIGLAWDGTGFGTDGAAWGGEALVASAAGFERIATFRPLPLAGGGRAIHQVWRIALALLDDAFEGDPPLDRLALFDRVEPGEIDLVRRMIASGLNSPGAHGVGRYFDAFGALALARTEAKHEAQVAMEFAAIAAATAVAPYDFELSRAVDGVRADSSPPTREIDLRPALREVVRDLLAAVEARLISARFHATLAAAGRAMVQLAAEGVGRLPVVLSGGCFQNPLLVERLRQELRGFDVYSHLRVPPNDGGLALGQIAVAAGKMGVIPFSRARRRAAPRRLRRSAS